MNYLDWFWLKNKNLLCRNCLYKFHIFWRYRKVSKWVSILRYRSLRLVSKLVIEKYWCFKMAIMVRYQKILVPEVGIETSYWKVLIPEKMYRYPSLFWVGMWLTNSLMVLSYPRMDLIDHYWKKVLLPKNLIWPYANFILMYSKLRIN